MDAEPNNSRNHVELREKVYNGDASVGVARVPNAWELFAAVKYESRAVHGPREPDPAGPSLDDLAEALLNVLEATWRQGHRNEALIRVATKKMKERRKSP